MKHIAIRVDDDLFYSTKKYILEQGLSLQTYVGELIKKDLQSKNAYTNFPGNTFKMVDEMSEDELLQLMAEVEKRINTKRQ